MATPSIDLVRVKLMDQDPTSLGDMDDSQISALNDALIDLRTNGQWTQLSKDERTQATRLAQNIRTHIARTVAVNQGRGQPKRAFEGHRTAVPQTQIGTTANIAKYGKRAGLANINQLVQRATDGYTGDGQYDSIPQRASRCVGHSTAMPHGRADTYAPPDPRKRRPTEEDGFQGEGAYWGNRLGGMVPYIGRFVAPLASKAEDWAIGKAIDYAKDYVGRGDYYEEARHEGIQPSQGDYMQGPGRWAGSGEYSDPRSIVINNNQQSSSGGVLRTNQIVDPDKPFARKPAQISDNGRGGLTIRHREYIRDIIPSATTTSDGFQSQVVLELNPGLKETFPLLSQFAKFYSQYKFKQLFGRYRSVIPSGNNQAAGTVMMATIYDSNAIPFTEKRPMDNSSYTVSGTVMDTLVAGVEQAEELKALGGMLFVRTGKVPKGSTNTYDQGILQVSTAGATPGLVCGELWLDYEVELDKLRDTGGVTAEIGDGYAVGIQSADYWLTVYDCTRSAFATGPDYVDSDYVSNFPMKPWSMVDGTPASGVPGGRLMRRGPTTQPGRTMAITTAMLQNMQLQVDARTSNGGTTASVRIRTVPNSKYLFTVSELVEIVTPVGGFGINGTTQIYGFVQLSSTGGGVWSGTENYGGLNGCRLSIETWSSNGNVDDQASPLLGYGHLSLFGSSILTAPTNGGEITVTIHFDNVSFNAMFANGAASQVRVRSFNHSLVRIE